MRGVLLRVKTRENILAVIEIVVVHLISDAIIFTDNQTVLLDSW